MGPLGIPADKCKFHPDTGRSVRKETGCMGRILRVQQLKSKQDVTVKTNERLKGVTCKLKHVFLDQALSLCSVWTVVV